MPETLPISKTLSIRNCGLDEYWLQALVANEPGILGLGELEVVKREKIQSSGGRLDLLLVNPEDYSMFEVELMLGPTDETHIIRVIEYWDLERRQWPKRRHTAVLVAEGFNRRFFNVVQLLSLTIPIIAIQAAIVEVEGKRCLHLAKVLDEYREPDIELQSSPERSAEALWKKKAPELMDILQTLQDHLAAKLSKLSRYYLKRSVSLMIGDYYLFRLKSQDQGILLEFWLGKSAEQAPQILGDAGLAFERTKDADDFRFGLTVTRSAVEKNLLILAQLADLAAQDLSE